MGDQHRQKQEWYNGPCQARPRRDLRNNEYGCICKYIPFKSKKDDVETTEEASTSKQQTCM